ncbi:fibrinogen-like protein 1 [Anopheles darlingi]|uniref:fibrinogen-like protein 1 n=1 Tax=Anopheles darlingi TaxID=43151 RepID=UPI0021006333|nr:fibrinogen-like protein 1 [Anopheles darlingi]
MYRSVWLFVVSFFATAMLVNSNPNVEQPSPSALVDVSGFSLEMLLTNHDILHHMVRELREDALEQRQLIVENQVQLKRSLELLAALQQEANDRHARDSDELSKFYAESRKAIADNRIKQEQSVDLLAKIQLDMQRQREEIVKNRAECSEWNSEWQKAIANNQVQQERNTGLLHNLPSKLTELKLELSRQREEANRYQLTTEKHMEQLNGDHKQIRKALVNIQLDSYGSCKEVPTKVSGKYKIRMNENIAPSEAYCYQAILEGGWMDIQFRSSGALDFNRNWTDYRSGFGTVNGEQWIGLEKIYQFTKEHKCELYVGMKDFNETYKYARYDAFAIGSEAEGYYLKTLGTHSGTAGDSLRYSEGSKFSTPDRDNDANNNNCAQTWKGGWWFKSCHQAFLNGLHRNTSVQKEGKIEWYGFSNEWRGLSFSRMLIRPLD